MLQQIRPVVKKSKKSNANSNTIAVEDITSVLSFGSWAD